MAEREGVDSSGDKGDGAKMAGRTILYRDGGQRQAEEGHQWLMAKAAFFYDLVQPKMSTVSTHALI